MIICSYSNIDIIQGVIGYGDAEGITDWRIANTSNGILNILNSSSVNTRISINTNGNVGIGSKDPSTITDLLDVSGNINISGIYEINNRDVINDTSNYVLSTSNILVNRIISSTTGGGGGTSQWTNVSSGIYYNTSNVGIGTAVVESKLHIYDAITNTTKLTIQNASPDTIPTSTPLATTTGTSGIYTYQVFTGQTPYTINFPTGGIVCDILMVGGGGGGGGGAGGGGGGGGVVYKTAYTINAGSYIISVGAGGIGGSTTTTAGSNGSNTTFGNLLTALGGGGGGGDAGQLNGLSGGSGGGAANETQVGSRGSSTQPTSASGGYGNVGGLASNDAPQYGGGGGGGGGGVGGAGSGSNGGSGGVGIIINITGSSVYYAGGGAGGAFSGAIASGGLGGGGNTNQNGTINTGGGGGSKSSKSNGNAGSGGSGIVIIRYIIPITLSAIELVRGTANDGVIDYKIGNYGGEFKIQASVNNTDTDYVRITSAGASIYNPTGSPQWSTTSDQRIKENIEKASYDICYDNINKLDLYRFNYINGFNNVNKDLRQLGYIAQEVQDIFPKAVSSYTFDNNDVSIPDLLSIDITQINYSLYGAVKKLIKLSENKEELLNKLIEMNEDKRMRIKRLKTLLNIDTINIAIDTSNIPIDTSNLTIDTSNLSIDTSNLSIDTSNISQ
jgi:hypothetical protein